MAFDIDTDRLRLAMECISKGVENMFQNVPYYC